jgi:hypothetical protein
MRLESKCLFTGAVLTLLLLFVCPKFTITGDRQTRSSYKSPGIGMRSVGPNQYNETIEWKYRSFKHFAPELFWGGEIVIWTTLLGIYLHRSDKHRESNI